MSTVLFDTPGPRALARQRIYTVVVTLVLGGLVAVALWRLWTKEMITPDQWVAFTEPRILMSLLEELVLATLAGAAVAIVLAVAFGAVFAAGRLADPAWVRLPCWAVVEFFRAVPVLLLIFVLFFGFPILGTFWSLVLALMLYNGSVLAEIFRAGIQAVPKGQSEAAYAIGMTKTQVLIQILAPQALRSMLPAIISQCIVALKDTTLGFAIGASGIVDVGERIYLARVYNNPFVVGIVLAAVFIVINYSLSKLAEYLESRMRRQGTKTVHVAATGDDVTASG